MQQAEGSINSSRIHSFVHVTVREFCVSTHAASAVQQLLLNCRCQANGTKMSMYSSQCGS
jgi:hypothetical protein